MTCAKVWAPKLWRPKNTFLVFFFQLYFNKKYVEMAIDDFTMHLVISKWLRIQKCRQKKETMSQRVPSEKRNCQRKCFHSINYVIDHARIRFFFYVNRLHCFVWFLLYYLLRPGEIARPMPIGSDRARNTFETRPIFRRANFAL